MKKIISIFLLLSIALPLFACGRTEIKEISCEEIIKAYEDAGYHVRHYDHKDEGSSDYYCYIIVHKTEDPDSDLADIRIYFTEEGAKEAAKFDKYHIVKWVFALPFGETRWLKSGHYGKIEYSSYSSELLKPLKQLIK